MPRKAAIDRPAPVEVSLSESMRGRLDLHLLSTVEHRVPKGAYKEFFEERIKEYFSTIEIDLQPFGFAAGSTVRAKPEVMNELLRRLKIGR